jgi:hypothetical protein
MTTRSRIVSFGTAILMVVAGGVGASVFSGTTGQVVALVLIGLGLVLATGLVFLEVGLSEDRERAREAERLLAAETRPDPLHPPRPASKRARLARMRGSRRRVR